MANVPEMSRSLADETVLSDRERRAARFLLKGGVPLTRIRDIFADSTQDTSENVFDIGTLHHFDFIASKDSNMQVEFFETGFYFQNGSMTKRLRTWCCLEMCVVDVKVNSNFVSLVIFGSGPGIGSHAVEPLAICLSSGEKENCFRSFLEIFVKRNCTFCASIQAVVVDCDKDNIQFVQNLIPKAGIVWSRRHTSKQLSNELCENKDDLKGMAQLQLNLSKLIDSPTEQEYESNLKEIVKFCSMSVFKEFLQKWDSCKHLWVKSEIFKNRLFSLWEQNYAFIQVLFEKTDERTPFEFYFGNFVKSKNTCHSEPNDYYDPAFQLYQALCTPQAALEVCRQLAIGLSSHKLLTVDIFKRTVYEGTMSRFKFKLPDEINDCTCEYFIKSEGLPCSHMFVALLSKKTEVYRESLIPDKFKLFDESLTLNTLADRLSYEKEVSPSHYIANLQQLGELTKEMITACLPHSPGLLSADVKLISQVLNVLRKSQSDSTNLVKCTAEPNPLTQSQNKPKHLPPKRGPGRPSKKQKLLDKKPAVTKTTPSHDPTLTPRHNLRTNIKHKFVKRESVNRVHEPLGPGEISEIVNNVTEYEKFHSEDISQMESLIANPNDNNGSSLETYKGNKRDSMADNKRVTNIETMKNFGADLLNTDDEDSSSDNIDDYDDENDESDDTDEDDVNDELYFEKLEAKKLRLRAEIEDFMNEIPRDKMREMLECVSTPCTEEPLDHDTPHVTVEGVEALVGGCRDMEIVEFVQNTMKLSQPGYDPACYKAAACVVWQAHHKGAQMSDILTSLCTWPPHMLRAPQTPVTLEDSRSEDHILNIFGHKVTPEDMTSLLPGRPLTSNIVHAYLDTLAQRHSSAMFVIPFDMVHHWRNGSYTSMLFPKVHLKTFDFIILPICCGSEFTESEQASMELGGPTWMVMVGDVRNKTVCMLNPRHEDKFSIAAHGYMLQFRRYMQIRSVHTGEMLPLWDHRVLKCNTQGGEHTSGVLMLMNVEAVICGAHPAVMTEAHIPRYLHYMASTLRDSDRETTVLCVGGTECQQQAAKDADWLQCENCRTWWHRACAQHGPDGHRPFYCSGCLQRISLVGGKLVDYFPGPEDKHMDLMIDQNMEEDGAAEFEVGQEEEEEEVEV